MRFTRNFKSYILIFIIIIIIIILLRFNAMINKIKIESYFLKPEKEKIFSLAQYDDKLLLLLTRLLTRFIYI